MRPPIIHHRRPRSPSNDLQTARPGDRKGPALVYEIAARVPGLDKRPVERPRARSRNSATTHALGAWLGHKLAGPDADNALDIVGAAPPGALTSDATTTGDAFGPRRPRKP